MKEGENGKKKKEILKSCNMSVYFKRERFLGIVFLTEREKR